MKRPFLTLTRSKQIGVVCWAIILLADLVAFRFPVRGLPLPLRVALTVLLAAVALAVVVTSLGLFTERGDERAEGNQRRTDAALFQLFFLCMAACLLFTKSGGAVTLGRREILFIFAAVCLAKDVIFLGYERFGR